MDEVEIFFCPFPNPWALKVSGMGGYTSKCEKKSKSLHPTVQGPCPERFDLSFVPFFCKRDKVFN